MFDEKGQIIIAKEECDMDADDLMMLALDAGADDFNEEDEDYEILHCAGCIQPGTRDTGKREYSNGKCRGYDAATDLCGTFR